MARPEGVEPPTRGLGNRCSILLSYGRIKKNGAPEGIRTPGLLIRSQTIYPAELQARLHVPRFRCILYFNKITTASQGHKNLLFVFIL